MENQVEPADLLSPQLADAVNTATTVFQNEVSSVYTADDIAKAREQEKAKLYPQMEKMKEELAAAKARAEDASAKEAERETLRVALEKDAEAKRKQEEEDNLSFKELLAKKEQEFSSQLENVHLLY